MRRRLLLFFLPSIYAPASTANEALWNCAQNKDSKEWVCVGEKTPADKVSTPKLLERTEPAKDIQAAPTKAIENTQPIVAEPERVPVKNAEPPPAPVEKAKADVPKLPVNTKADQGTRQVKVESQPAAQSTADSSTKELLQTEANRP
ncbi:MAG: LPS-assembly protein LptD, partial [Methylobacter sp.]